MKKSPKKKQNENKDEILQILEEKNVGNQHEMILIGRGKAGSEKNIQLEEENKEKSSGFDDNPTLKCEASLENINSSLLRYDIKEEQNLDDLPARLSAKFLESHREIDNNTNNKKSEENQVKSTEFTTTCYSPFGILIFIWCLS